MDHQELLDYLLDHPESEFIEFKDSNFNPDNTGELVSALANGAVLMKKDEAYLVFGVDDVNHKIVGTKFDPKTLKKGNQPFKNWLSTNLDHCDVLKYACVDHSDGKVEIITIPRAKIYPVKFNGVEYIRVGESKKKLSEHPELARKLWEEILRVSFEDGNASDLLDEDHIFALLDFTPFFISRDEPIPENRKVIIEHMINEGVLIAKMGKYFITNLGALLFAKDLSEFRSLINRNIRLIKYAGTDKTTVERSTDGQKGYVHGIGGVIDYIMLLLPSEEYLDGGQRKTRQVFPRVAIRELIVNMLIHQDFSITGYAPRVEIYTDRIEFTNSGIPLIKVERFLDSNRSRNPKLAKLMRAMKLCEERGQGIDTVELECELEYLPSPAITAGDDFTRVTIFDHKTLRQFSNQERTNLIYMHCCLQYARHKQMNNETVRSRFGEGILSPTVASRWINETIERNLIKPFDPDSTSRRHARYVPFWA
jgi:ATP-dependent DNA helicase RecG